MVEVFADWELAVGKLASTGSVLPTRAWLMDCIVGPLCESSPVRDPVDDV